MTPLSKIQKDIIDALLYNVPDGAARPGTAQYNKAATTADTLQTLYGPHVAAVAAARVGNSWVPATDAELPCLLAKATAAATVVRPRAGLSEVQALLARWLAGQDVGPRAAHEVAEWLNLPQSTSPSERLVGAFGAQNLFDVQAPQKSAFRQLSLSSEPEQISGLKVHLACDRPEEGPALVAAVAGWASYNHLPIKVLSANAWHLTSAGDQRNKLVTLYLPRDRYVELAENISWATQGLRGTGRLPGDVLMAPGMGTRFEYATDPGADISRNRTRSDLNYHDLYLGAVESEDPNYRKLNDTLRATAFHNGWTPTDLATKMCQTAQKVDDPFDVAGLVLREVRTTRRLSIRRAAQGGMHR